MMTQAVLTMLAWISQGTGYNIPTDHEVQIVEISSAEMAERACGMSPAEVEKARAKAEQQNNDREYAVPIKVCKALGFYSDEQTTDTVYVEADAPEDVKESVEVHELTHWLQHWSGKFDFKSCEDTYKREVEAFRVQNAYIMQVQNKFEMYGVPPFFCPEKK